MVSNELGFDKDRFEAVWRRVTSENVGVGDTYCAKPPVDGDNDLCRLMDTTALNERHCRTLARISPRYMAKALHSMADDNCRQVKRLRTMHFIVTGVTYRPDVTGELFHNVSDGLRTIYGGASTAERGFHAAAKTSKQPEFADTYREFANIKRRHAERIGRMLEHMIK